MPFRELMTFVFVRSELVGPRYRFKARPTDRAKIIKPLDLTRITLFDAVPVTPRNRE